MSGCCGSNGCCGGGPDDGENRGCRCLIYKDPIFMTGQALSIGALLLGWGNIITILLGIASVVLFQVAWCCKLNKCAFITAGVLACVAGAGSIGVGIYAFTLDETVVACLGIIGGGLWIGAAVCVFIFACGRLQKLERKAQEDSVVQQSKERSETGKTVDEEHGIVVPVHAMATSIAASKPVMVAESIKSSPTPETQAVAVDISDDDSWSSEESVKTTVETTKDFKTKPDGTEVATQTKTYNHRDKTKTSVKKITLQKTLEDGSTKRQVSIIKTDANGEKTKTTKKDVLTAVTAV